MQLQWRWSCSLWPWQAGDGGGRRGQKITIPERPERIVVAGTTLYTEILLDIGAAGRIAGVTSSPDNPPEVAGPLVGLSYSPSLEAILALGPNLVLGAWGATREGLEAAGVTVLTTGWITGLSDIFKTIRTVGLAVGSPVEADGLIGRIAEEVVEIESKVFGLLLVRAAFLYMFAPDTPPYAAGAGSIESELILRAGGPTSSPTSQAFPR